MIRPFEQNIILKAIKTQSDSAHGDSWKNGLQFCQNIIDIGADTHYQQQGVIARNRAHQLMGKRIVNQGAYHVGIAGIGLHHAHLPRKLDALDSGHGIRPVRDRMTGNQIVHQSHFRKYIIITPDPIRSLGNFKNLEIP